MISRETKLFLGLMALIVILATLVWNEEQERKLRLAMFKEGLPNPVTSSVESKKRNNIGFMD